MTSLFRVPGGRTRPASDSLAVESRLWHGVMVRVFGRGLPGPRAGAGPVGPEDRDTGHGLSDGSGHGLLVTGKDPGGHAGGRDMPAGPAGRRARLLCMYCTTFV